MEEINFFNEYKEKFFNQLKPLNWVYVAYFLVYIVGIGGLGIWVSIYQEFNSRKYDVEIVAFNMATYFIALLASSNIDVNIQPKVKNKVSTFVFSNILFLFGIFIFTLVLNCRTYFSLFFSFVGLLVSLIIWHFANNDSEKFSDQSYNQVIRDEAKQNHGKDW